jgi:hypothetical protein
VEDDADPERLENLTGDGDGPFGPLGHHDDAATNVGTAARKYNKLEVSSVFLRI